MSVIIGTKSLASNLSWNTRISRTQLSTVDGLSLSRAPVLTAQGLDQLLRTIQQLGLNRYSFEELQHEAVVGEGESFRVERCIYNKAVVAVKHVKLENSQANVRSSYHRLQSVLLEIQIMRHGPLKDHPNILSALGYGWKSHGERLLPYVVVEYAAHGSMRAWLRETERGLKSKFKLAGDIASGLKALHLCDIIHGDLKLDNILVLPAPTRAIQVIARLCDFGHSIILRKGANESRYFGTILYNAPEVELQDSFRIDPENLHKVDIWAYGLSVWEIFLNGARYFQSSWANDPRYNSQSFDLPSYSQTSLSPTSPETGTFSIHTEKSYVMVPSKDSRHIPFSDQVTESALGTFCHRHLQPLSREFVDTLRFPGLTIEKGYLRKLLHNTLQFDPSLRPSQITLVPTMMDWDPSDQGALQEQLALHTGSSALNFEIFRFDQESEMPWDYKHKILRNLTSLAKHHSTQDQATTAASTSLQASFCYMVGFGVSPDLQVSLRFLEKATELEHPMALLFGSSLKQALVGNNTADAPLSPPGIVRESYTQNLILGFRADKFDVKGIELNDDDGALLVGPEKFQSYAALKVFLQSLNETQREKTIKLYVTTMPFSIRMDLLSLAISMDDVDTVRWLAKIYIRRKKITLHDETTLIQACRRGSVEMVMSLLDAGADPLKATEEGCSLYHWLFMLGDGVPIVVDKLLALQSTLKNKLLDQPCSRTYSLHQQWPLRLTGTPLAFAIECNSITAVKALLRLGASPYAPAYSNSERRSVIQWTPIHLAFKFHQADIIKLLLNEDSPFLSMAHEVAVNIVELAQSICYSTLIERIAIHGAARQMTALSETIRMLHPEVLSTPTKDGQTPLMQAIDFSNIDVVNAMIMAEPTLSEKRFVDPDDQKIFTYPAIFAAQVAAKRDSTNAFDIVKLLLQHIPYGTKLRDSQGRTPLHFSVTGSSTLTTKWLVMNGYDLDDFDSDMRTPIHNCRTAASLKILLDLGQDINQADRFGNTPLHNAALQGLEDMVEGLIFRNANLTVVGNIGSALHCAVLSQSRRVVSLLLKAGNGMDNKIDIHAVDSNGDTALHLAARILRPDLLQLLFSNRINRKIRNKAGLTAKSQLKAKRPYGFGKVKPHKLDTQNEVLEQERRVHGETKLVDDTSVSTCNTEGEGEGETETNIEDKPPGAGVVEISETEIRNDNGDSTKDMLPPLLPTEPIPKVDVETTSEFENENIGRSSSSSSSSSSSAEQPPHEASPQRPRTMLEEEVASALLQSFQNAEAQYLNDMLKFSKWNKDTLNWGKGYT